MPSNPATNLTHEQIKLVLPKGWNSGKEYKTKCPVCQGKSFCLFVKNGKEGFACMKGCDPSSLAKKLRELIGNGFVSKAKVTPSSSSNFASNHKDWTGYRLKQYSDDKGFGGVLWLTEIWGAYEITHYGKPVCAFPYMDENGHVLGVKVRIYKDKSLGQHFYWKPKNPRIPYGLWLPANLPDASGEWPKDVIICEGESDTQTYNAHGYSAIGISGVENWRPEFAELPVVKNAERIFVAEDNDGGAGKKFAERVCGDIAGKSSIIRFAKSKSGFKDANDLHTAIFPLRELDRLSWSEGFSFDECIVESAESAICKEALPELPKFTGTLHELADALCPDLPYVYKFAAAATVIGVAISGKISLRGSPHIQPRFYTCLVGVKGSGKSGSMKEVKTALAVLVKDDLKYQLSADSGPGLVQTLVANPRMLLHADEIVDIFDKGKQTKDSKNSLLIELLKLHDGNETENAAKGNIKAFGQQAQTVQNAHFALLGGATTQVFQQMWMGTRGAAGGLQDRFVLFASDQESIPEPQEPSKDGLLSVVERLSRQLDDGEVVEPLEIAKQRQEWWSLWKKEIGAGSRIPAIVSRMMLVLAITNDKRTVDAEILQEALAFGEYQIKVRQQLMPEDAYGWVQAFEQLILKVFRKHGQDGLTRNQVRRYAHPEKHPGGYGPFLQAWDNLKRVERLHSADTTQRSDIYVMENE